MRAILISVVSIALLFRERFAECISGCLKCDIGNDTCLYCDNVQGYVLKGKKCEKSSITNCSKLSLDGTCEECETGYYPLNGLCAMAETKIDNCAIMKSATECRYCASGFYLSGKNCTSIQNPIDNCLYYEDEGICSRCIPQSFLFIDQRFCIPITDAQNCVSWTQIQCRTCQNGYFLNPNKYHRDLFKFMNIITDTSSFLRSIKDQSMRFQTNICEQGLIPKCARYENPETCLQCETGYSLLNNYCYKIMISQNANCVEYDSRGLCTKCLPNFYLSDDTCKPVITIQYCQKYNSTAAFSQCLECLDDYFLHSNACVLRAFSLTMPFCEKIMLNRDACESCREGYSLTDDKLLCLPKLPNCKKYYPASSTSKTLQCEYCEDFYYLDAKIGKCVNGTVSNCKTFEQYSDECSICAEGYYLSSNGVCQRHLYFGNRTCLSWSSKIPNQCDSCPTNYIKIYNINSCNQLKSAIQFCDVYLTVNTCAKCQSGYIPSVDKKNCIQSTIANCVKESNMGTCAECGIQYDPTLNMTISLTLNSFKTFCELPDLTLMNNCYRIKSTSTSISCMGCKYLYYPAYLAYKRRRCLAPTNYKLKTPNIIMNIVDCEIMDLDLSECLKCISGKFVSNGGCVATCPSGQIIFRQEIIKDYVKNSIYIKRRNYCDVAPIANCIQAETSVNAIGLNYGGAIFQGCVQCAQGYMPLINIGDTKWGMGHVYSADSQNQSSSNRFPFIHECVSTTVVQANLLSATTSITHCRYLLKSGTQYGCMSCEFGYTGTVVYANGAYFIESCVTMTTCNASKLYTGLGGLPGQLKSSGIQKFPLDLYVSCHECVDTTQLVVFEMNIGHTRSVTATGIQAGLSIWNVSADPPYSALPSLSQTVCMNPNSNWNMPANCAVIMVVADLPLKGYVNGEPISSTGIFCVACKPGYRATANSNGYVTACTLINNCTIAEFNGCKSCQAGYAQGWNEATGTLDLGYCHLTVKSPYCLFGYVNIYGIFVCAICEEGYALNHDYLCDLVEIPNCSSLTIYTEFTTTSPFTAMREPFLILIWFDPNGCKTCSSGQLVAEGSTEPYCVKNLFQTNYGFTSSSYFSKNCAESYFDLTTSSVRCSECNTGTTMINNRCYPLALAEQIVKLGSCAVYDSYTQKCAKCTDFHFLDAGICYDGFLPFCAEYESWEKCRRCQQGYILIQTKTNNTVCLDPGPNLNCKSFNVTSSLNGELECSACMDGFYAATTLDEKPSYTCLEITAVKNCELHKMGFNYRDSTFECLQCKSGYYLKFNFCFNRTTIKNCAQYDPYENKCLFCQNGYEVSANGFHCEILTSLRMPIPNCRQLFDLTTCSSCIENYYLGDNECLEVPSNKRIKYCQYYNSQMGCERCIKGFFNLEGQCQLAKAQDCAEYENSERCLSCFSGFGLRVEGNIQNCVEVNLPYCDQFNPSKPYPFECLLCSQDYYISDETRNCFPVETKIEFCNVYKDANTCSQCQNQMAISPDGKYCYASPDILGFVDSNCLQSYLSNEPICNACAPGYYFNSKGTCTVCKNNMVINGCMYCDPENNDVCLMCLSGYFMNNNGLCIREPLPPVGKFTNVLTIVASLFLLVLMSG